MKTLCAALVVFSVVTGQAFAQAEFAVKQRAKQLSNENNARQGVAPSSASPQSKAPSPSSTAETTAPLTAPPQQQSAAMLKADLAAVRAKGQATPELKQQFVKDLFAAVRGSAQPSSSALNKLADSLLTAVATKGFSPTNDTRLVQNIIVALNSAGLSSTRTQEIADEFQASMEKAGVPSGDANATANDLKAIATEVQKGAAK